MTVNVSKPALNVREKLAELDKPTGIAGEAMLRAETPQEQFNLIGAGRRNLIINGNFMVSQRGDYTTAVTLSGGTYYLDRWKGKLAGATATVQDTGYAAKITATSSATGQMQLFQVIDPKTTEPMADQVVTFSAKVKSNSTKCRLLWEEGGVGWGSETVTHSGSGEYEKLSITFTIPSTISSNELRLYIGIDGAGGASVSVTSGEYVEFTEVQLELGKVATPFEHRSYGEELALCQRYYYEVGKESGSYMSNVGFPRGGGFLNLVYATVGLPTEMRTTPTLGYGGTLEGVTYSGGYSAVTTTGPVVGDGTGKKVGGLRVQFPSNWTAGDEVLIKDNDGTGFISFDAEL